MNIIKSKLPNNSILNNIQIKYDFVDSYRGKLIDSGNKFTLIDISNIIFLSVPIWVSQLFKLRNILVSVFGLKIPGKLTDRNRLSSDFKYEPGEQIGLFKVFNKTRNEIVLGQDDKHLNFRISLFLEQSFDDQSSEDLTISSMVIFNNWFGRLYFLLVKPFHKLIVPAMLKSALKELKIRQTASH